MEQMYMVEIFVDKVSIFPTEEDDSSASKRLIIKIKFGPKVQFIIKERQLVDNDDVADDINECNESGRRSWTRIIRVGKSYLFPSYPDTLLMTLSRFPLEIEIWNDDQNEVEIFVGIGTMQWDTEFYHMLKETAEPCKRVEPLTMKQVTPIFAECCCRQCGEIAFILRLSSLGDSITTEFQQLMKDPELFVFRTDRAPSVFQCKRIEGDDPNFLIVGSLYETTTLEDPNVVGDAEQKVEVCTDLQSCAIGQQKDGEHTCQHGNSDTPKKKYPMEKIRMGEITGPCGNTNCPLAHKIKTYIRNLDTYKKATEGQEILPKGNETKNICGKCVCKDDRWHRDKCPGGEGKTKDICKNCGGITDAGATCKDKKEALYGQSKSNSPSISKSVVSQKVQYVTVPTYEEIIYGHNEYIIQNAYNLNSWPNKSTPNSGGCGCCKPNNSMPMKVDNSPKSTGGCGCKSKIENPSIIPSSKPYTEQFTSYISPVKLAESKRQMNVFNVQISDVDDCKCDPPKPQPPCKTFDCTCITEKIDIASRKAHKPYCPAYKHRSTCPVTMKRNEEEEKADDDEDEVEPLPYGLPPIQLGPCPVMGRPCIVPDGFAKMYKTAAMAPLPPSYSDAGKVCCSKEYERIKKAIKEYMQYEKDHDFRCINQFNVDTERRCCDKEQKLFPLTGTSCCGKHKLAIQDKYKKDEGK